MTPSDEREALNELARQQYAERFDDAPAEVASMSTDVGSAETMRDRALQAHLQKRQQMDREQRERRRRRQQQQAAPRREPTQPPADVAVVIAAVPGVGPAKQAAILSRFPAADVLADASVDEIAAVPGIGVTLAERIKRAVG